MEKKAGGGVRIGEARGYKNIKFLPRDVAAAVAARTRSRVRVLEN